MAAVLLPKLAKMVSPYARVIYIVPNDANYVTNNEFCDVYISYLHESAHF